MPLVAFEDYIERLLNEGRDMHGRKNRNKYGHLPLICFVDKETGEEFVLKEFPKKPLRLVSSKGTLVADLYE